MERTSRSVATVLVLAWIASGCAFHFKEEEKKIEAMPINCSTAEGDLRMLQHEKANVAERMAMGVTSIVPASLVVGVVTRTEKTKVEVAIGEYNEMIDKRMADIRAQCGL